MLGVDDASPFGGPIAISFSGGGGRAVGFHLGTLSYLDHIDLLREVSILSSVSGGTFMGAGYALSVLDGKPFQEFYEGMYEFLASNLVLGSVLTELVEQDPPPSGRRNVVTALANVYDKWYFHGRTFGAFWEKPDIHLEDIIFNATEFKTGIAFRFQKSRHQCRIGNGNVWLEEGHAKLMRMADIMTASSCIPGGLEPLFFPEDFRWPGPDGGKKVCAEVKRALNERFGTGSIALMDGGVYDNQGMSSVMLAVNRQRKFREELEVEGEGESHIGDVTLTGRVLPGGKVVTSRGVVHPPPIQETPAEQEERLLRRESMVGRARGQHLLELIHGQTVSVPGGGGDAESGSGSYDTPAHDLLGLFILSDTPVRKDPVYAPREPDPPGRFTLGHLAVAYWILLGASFVSLLVGSFDFVTEVRNHRPGEVVPMLQSIFAVLVPLILTGGLAFGLIWVRMKLRRVLDAMPAAQPGGGAAGDKLRWINPQAASPLRARKPWHYLKRIPVRQFAEMVGVRVSSMFAMTNEVFLNRIRDLGYALVHSQPDLEDKIIANEIVTLLDIADDRDLPVWMAPSRQMTEVVVREAAGMGTKLWWRPIDAERRNELDILIAAGHITTCYNLLVHIWRRYDREPRMRPSAVKDHGVRGRFKNRRIEEIFSRVEADWHELKEDAYALVDQRRPDTEPARTSRAMKAVAPA